MSASTPQLTIHTRQVKVEKDLLERMQTRTAELDRFGNHILKIDVEIQHSERHRNSENSWHIEISASVRGHIIRATGEANDPGHAFEKARAIMEANLRRAARRHHWSRHGRKSVMKTGQSFA
jgi:ribosomal subunit interface protein